MPILSKPSSAARMAVIYVTLGALTLVWSGIWYWYLQTHPPGPERESLYYWCWGFILTGAVLFLIGITLGQIGRAARHAELPPPEATPVEATAEINAASRAPIVAPVNPAMPVATSMGAAVMPGAVPAQPVQPAQGAVPAKRS